MEPIIRAAEKISANFRIRSFSIFCARLRAGRTMLDCYFWLLDDEDAAAPLEPPPGLSRLKRELWKKKARKGTLREAA